MNHLGSEVEGNKQENSYMQSDNDPSMKYSLMIQPGVMLHHSFTLLLMINFLKPVKILYRPVMYMFLEFVKEIVLLDKTVERKLNSSFMTPATAPLLYTNIVYCCHMFNHHLCLHRGVPPRYKTSKNLDYKTNSYYTILFLQLMLTMWVSQLA